MNFHLLKFLKAAALMSVVSLSFVACNSGETPNKPETSSSSSSSVILFSSTTVTKISPIKINNFGVSQVSASRFLLTGNVVIDYTDTTVTNVDSVRITDIKFNVGIVQLNGLGDVGATVQMTNPVTFPTERVINFNEVGAAIDVMAFDACGDFVVEVFVFSSSPDNKNQYISKETASFSKSAEIYCVEPISSSSVQEVFIEMEPFEAILTTNKTSGNVAIDFETGTVYTALTLAANKAVIDAVLVYENGIPVLKSARIAGLDGDYPELFGGNDTKFAEETKAYDSYPGIAIPPPIYTNMFASLTPTMGAIEDLSFGLYYVAQTTSYNPETKDGFYAFMVGKPVTEGKNVTIPFTIYKKK